MRSATPLQLAGTYHRRVRASLRRIWENVHDWEHLAHLHADSFAACELLDRGSWGWRARLVVANSDEQVIELIVDPHRDRYVSTTLQGTGKGTEIRVQLTPLTAELTDVLVEFHVPETRPQRLAQISTAYAAVYERLWDEDEAMMRERERMLAATRSASAGPAELDLGGAAVVRAKLPLLFGLAGRSFRLVELNGALIAHSTVCPHWLGPLGDAPVEDGTVRCPWHGYRFDVVSGACVGHPPLKLDTAPAIRIEHGRVLATFAG